MNVLFKLSSSALSVSVSFAFKLFSVHREHGGAAAPGTMSGRGEEAGESSGSQEPAGAAEPQKRRPGRPRKPQKVSLSLCLAAVHLGRSAVRQT